VSNALLAPLGYYGGPTQTMALLPGSLAINAGTNGAGIPATDQRGFGRVGAVDIGAFESQGFTIVVTSGSGQSTNVSSAFSAPLVVTVTANNPIEPVAGGLVTFTPPASGASATISGSPATISATGTASVTATANGLSGTYTVFATASGITTPASFSLANRPTIVLLDPSGKGALTDSGNGTIVVRGNSDIVVASTNAASVIVSGNGGVTATYIDLKSTTGTQVSGNGKLNGQINTGIPASEAADPLASLAVPTAPATQYSAANISGNSVVTLQPGTYVGGIHISGNAHVTLAPGIYYLSGGGFSVSGNAVVTGNGVLLYNAPKTTADVISISSNASVTLTAATSGTYSGIVIFQARTSTAPITVTGSASVSLTGALYAAAATVTLSGNESLTFQGTSGELIVSDLSESGNALLSV
jgi:hypothetical protein